MPHRPMIALLLLALTVLACTLSPNTDSGGDPPQIVTATLSDSARTLVEMPAALVLTEPIEPTLAAPPTATDVPPATATDLPTDTPPPSRTPTIPAPPTFTPPPTIPPTPVPTRTIPGPPTQMPLDDGSGNTIFGTGSTTNSADANPIPTVNALPRTLYYLSDVGDQAQVFRLRIGLNHPDQLTFSPYGVAEFSVAPDGTVAYVDGTGNLIVGGIPVPPYANPDGTTSPVYAPVWSPAGDWLAYIVSASLSSAAIPTTGPQDGLYIRNREGQDRLLRSSNFGDTGPLTLYWPYGWRPDGSEVLFNITSIDHFSVGRITITGGAISEFLTGELVTPWEARWSADGSAIIASMEDRIVRVDPNLLTITDLLDPAAGIADVSDAQQWADGTLTFLGHTPDGTLQLYIQQPGSTPQAVTETLDMGSEAEYLWNSGSEPPVIVTYPPVESTFGTAYLRTLDGVLIDLTPLTGPVAAPQWGPIFQVRDWARVNTTAGDTLNVREYPALNARVVTGLRDGARVGIVSGPREAEGFRWWQVRTPDGVVGWAVEWVLDERGQTLRTLAPTD